jgi:hypothetical protein
MATPAKKCHEISREKAFLFTVNDSGQLIKKIVN